MRKFFRIACFFLMALSAAALIFTACGAVTLPDCCSAVNGQMDFGSALFSGVAEPQAATAFPGEQTRTVTYKVRFLNLFPVKTVSVNVTGRRYVAVGGELVGVRLKTRGLLVVSTEPFQNDAGQNVNPAADAGLKKGDILLKADGKELTENALFVQAIEDSGGNAVELLVLRNGEEHSLAITPQKTAATGAYKGGVWVKGSIVGVGTLTFSDPETGTIAALGHGIYDADTASLLTVSDGEICTASISSVKKGAPGAPGEITGIIGGKELGTVTRNCDSGVFGELGCIDGEPDVYPVATYSEVHTGPAQILCTAADGEKQTYDIEIRKIGDPDDGEKNMTLKITDQTLLSLTGGIVQGMSGSPILQDGMFVGAVTHVFVNDPKSGYGILAEKMMEELEDRE